MKPQPRKAMRRGSAKGSILASSHDDRDVGGRAGLYVEAAGGDDAAAGTHGRDLPVAWQADDAEVAMTEQALELEHPIRPDGDLVWRGLDVDAIAGPHGG